MKKQAFITLLQELEQFSNPKLEYEQYVTDAISAADVLYYIAFEKDGLDKKLVIDLGCGTGIFSIGALLLGANHVIMVDVDKDALNLAMNNLNKLELTEQAVIISGDIYNEDTIQKIKKAISDYSAKSSSDNFELSDIILISNPPFGVHRKGADIEFIKAALELSTIIYSIHLGGKKNFEFLKKKIPTLGGIITEASKLNLLLKKTYSFHQKAQKRVECSLLRIERKKRIK